MTKMSWTHSSKGTTLLVLLAVALAAVGTATAISVDAETVPDESEVGTDVSAELVIADPFTDADEWTLHGETALEDVSWTVIVLDQGDEVSQQTYGEQSFNQTLTRSGGGDEVVIELAGTAPEVENYTYDPAQTYTVASLVKIQGSNSEELDSWEAHYYTEESREARQALDAADAAIESVGGNQEAEQLYRNAVSAYEGENFGNAVDLANQAESRASQAQQSQQTTQYVLIGVGVLVVLALVGGGIYYWKSQQGPSQKLR
jgi:F0F1-type ATP synthase membrane subunit c/vacuolar-type H+-ATPase subunit K